MANIDKESCREVYNKVRDDTSDISWATFKYDGSTIVPGDQGANYEDFVRTCTDDNRQFAYIRFATEGDLGKRLKYVFIVWIGENVSILKRTKIGTDKTLVKDVLQDFSVELVITDPAYLEEGYMCSKLKNAQH